MRVISALDELRLQVKQWRLQGLKICFVPTMGNLHAGHLSLLDKAQRHGDKVVVSIFVNPLQFNDQSDLAAYPRTIETDITQLNNAGCDLVFMPDTSTMYPDGLLKQTKVVVPDIGDRLCGAYRPGHFDGVATVVTKLLSMVMPDTAVFGAKDYQQLLLIKKVVHDLSLPVDIVAGDIIRQNDGLALSSRNQYLSAAEKETACKIYQALLHIKQQLERHQFDFIALCSQQQKQLELAGLEVDYIEICREVDLMPAQVGDKALRIFIAAQLGPARLIDNISCYLA